ncbi:MAG: zf-HC2 domain-containing protein [bacterium]
MHIKRHVRDQKISALIDGELSPEEREAIIRHIDQCQRCRGKLLKWQQVDHCLVHSERTISPPALLEHKILAHVQRQESSSAADSAPFCKHGLNLRFAAACLVALGIFLGTLMGTKLTACLVREQEGIDLMAVLSPQEIYSPSLAEMNLESILEGES